MASLKNPGSRSRFRIVGLGLLLLSVSVLGCSDELKKFSISANLKFEGKPIEKGEIKIAPVGGAGRPDSTIFANGQYQLSVTPGKKVVRISAWSSDPTIVGSTPLGNAQGWRQS